MPAPKRYIDIHSHIIFGADDGAGSLDEAIELLKLDRDEGAYAVFATPHYGSENIYTPEASLVMQKFELLKERAAKEVPEVKLYLGTEWYCSYTLARRIRQRQAFRMNDTDYVLTEFLEYRDLHGNHYEDAERIVTNLTELKKQGFNPILAHPERYTALQEDWDLTRKLCENGILLQVNAYDLALNLSPKTRELAQWMAKERMISFIGSDMHRLIKRPPKMKDGIEWLYEHTDEDYADAVAFGNAEKLLTGKKDSKPERNTRSMSIEEAREAEKEFNEQLRIFKEAAAMNRTRKEKTP